MKKIFLVGAMLTAVTTAIAKDLEHCRNNNYDIVIRSAPNSGFTALIKFYQSMVGQFQVHFGSDMNEYQGNGFQLFISNGAPGVSGRPASFYAFLAGSLNISGQDDGIHSL